LLTIVPLIKRQGGRLIAITGNADSSLAGEADIHLDARVDQEACPLNLAPTASTTAALALGDALAVALLDARGFGAEDFARSHPGGALGRRLLTHVRDIMRPIDDVPHIGENATVAEAVLAISRGGMGMTAIVTEGLAVVGIFTDGDLRRAMEKLTDLKGTPVTRVMTRNPRTIGPERLAAETAQMMEEHRINQILVVENGVLVGALNTHDLFRAKVI
jgi:arabinose-5-phosphate isomerase